MTRPALPLAAAALILTGCIATRRVAYAAVDQVRRAWRPRQCDGSMRLRIAGGIAALLSALALSGCIATPAGEDAQCWWDALAGHVAHCCATAADWRCVVWPG